LDSFRKELAPLKNSDLNDRINFGYLQIWRTFTYAALAKLNLAEEMEYWKKEGKKGRQQLLRKLYFSDQ